MIIPSTRLCIPYTLLLLLFTFFALSDEPCEFSNYQVVIKIQNLLFWPFFNNPNHWVFWLTNLSIESFSMIVLATCSSDILTQVTFYKPEHLSVLANSDAITCMIKPTLNLNISLNSLGSVLINIAR